MPRRTVPFLQRWSERTATQLGASQIFRPRVGYVIAGLWVVVTLVWLVLAARSGTVDFLLQLPLAAFMAVAVYATFIRPLVAVRRDGVLLRNVIRDIEVPWGALQDLNTQYALTVITTDGRKFAAWAAPAASRFSTARATRSDLQTVQWDEANGPIPASASLRSDSGAAAAVVRRMWNTARQDQFPTHDRVVVRWVTPLILALTLTLLASIATLSVY